MAKKIANLIGLVGQSCAGKNLVADFLEEKGYAVIDADKVAHTVLQEQSEAVIARFSTYAEKQSLRLRTQEGALNRKALGVLLFSDAALLAEHEAFILPKIEARVRSLINTALTEQPNRPVILNAPTLHKTSLTPECSFILYIKAPFFIRLIRGKKTGCYSALSAHCPFFTAKRFLCSIPFTKCRYCKRGKCSFRTVFTEKNRADTARKGFLRKTMEQKKILWVILSVSLFVLIIFGIALFLYSPSRNSATALAGGETVPYETTTTSTNVDPDLWARDPDRVAGLDRNAPAAAGNIINLNNLNIISTDGQSGQTNGIDVSDLTVQAGDADVSGLPKELAAQIGIDTAPEQPEEQPVSEKKEEAPSSPKQL